MYVSLGSRPGFCFTLPLMLYNSAVQGNLDNRYWLILLSIKSCFLCHKLYTAFPAVLLTPGELYAIFHGPG